MELDFDWPDSFQRAVHDVIAFSCPGIKNLKVEKAGGRNYVITFDEGTYTKEEVLQALEVARSWKITNE